MDGTPGFIQFFAIRDDHEPPRLDAPRRGRGHGSAQQFFDNVFTDGPVQELANAAASMEASKASIRTLLLSGLCSPQHSRSVWVAPEPICREAFAFALKTVFQLSEIQNKFLENHQKGECPFAGPFHSRCL